MTQEEIKLYLHNNKVCVVTNSVSLPGSLLLPSLKTYIDYLPIHNFWVIPGLFNNSQCYGLNAFLYMLSYMLSNDHFDYVIYLDEDVFVKDFSLLINEFEFFKNCNSCMGGIQDGGILCHRNHSKLLVNTFISFWNIKMYREAGISVNKLYQYVEFNIGNTVAKKQWMMQLSEKNKKLFETIEKRADQMIKIIEKHRKTYVKTDNFESEYAATVRNDNTNHIEQNQVPYTCDDYTSDNCFEPYYLIEQFLVTHTQTPIYYMFATDFYDEEYKDKCDTSGLTTAVRTFADPHNIIAVHTWFTRAYNKWPTSELELFHTKRINSIIKTFSHI